MKVLLLKTISHHSDMNESHSLWKKLIELIPKQDPIENEYIKLSYCGAEQHILVKLIEPHLGSDTTIICE